MRSNPGLFFFFCVQRALEEAALLEKRQRFFMFAVVVIHSAIRWRNDWKERKWKMAKFAEALAGLTEEKVCLLYCTCSGSLKLGENKKVAHLQQFVSAL